MSKFVRLCETCKSKSNENSSLRGCGYSSYLKEDDYTCHICGRTVIDLKMLSVDYVILTEISDDPKFIESMIQLQESDIIEYNLKMSQFRAQVPQKSSNTVHCPKCGSTSITTGARGVNWTFGLIGADKTVNRCANCGYKWKPGK